MNSSLEWSIGLLISIVALIGGVIARDRQVAKTIIEGDEKLHEKANKIKNDYVRRDDLNGHMKRIETTLNGMRDEQRETNRRIDTLLTAMTKNEK